MVGQRRGIENHMSSKPAYRPDIDGLRAVAVLSVMLYHFGATWLPGGFTGVDIFFVISGFVITLKLRREIEAGEFSIIGFYDGRVRRILPAALAVILTSIVAGYFLLWPGDYESLGASAAYSAAGLANLFFFWNTGYFDQESGLQPLLHFWSLGVEEQFYVAWPVVLWVTLSVTRSRPKVVLALLTAATALAFVYAERRVGYDPKAAFYLPQFRAWELSLGALLVFVPTITNRALSILAAMAGVALIVFSFLAIHETGHFPGVNAAYACIGASLLIWPQASNPVAATLSLRPVIFVGKISYSLYLWHWPVWVFYRHYNNGVPASLPEAILLAALTFTLATLSWLYVEKPFRRPLGNRWKVVAAGLVSVALVAFAGNTVVSNAGFLSRTSTATEPLSSLATMWEWNCPSTVDLPGIGTNCSFGAPWGTASERIILWGDSHAEHMAPLLQVYAAKHNASVVLYRACSPAFDNKQFIPSHFEYPDYDVACGRAHDAVVSLAANDSQIDEVVLASSWSSVADTIVGADRQDSPSRKAGVAMLEGAVESTARQLVGAGVAVSVIATVPIWPTDPVPCAVNTASNLLRKPCAASEHSVKSAAFDDGQADEYRALELAASDAGASIIEPGKVLCTPGPECIAWVDGDFLYRDRSHFRRNLPPATMAKLADMLGIEKLFTE